MSTLAENVLTAGAENRSPMLEKGCYDTWQSRMLLYIKGKEHGEMLLDSIFLGPFESKEIIIPANEATRRPSKTRMQTLKDLTLEERIRKECDIRAANIILHGLPNDIYTLLNHRSKAYDTWYRLKELMEGTELTKQERESKLADEFDRFTSDRGKTIQSYYMRFVTGVKQARNLHEVSFDQLYAYLKQNEPDANEDGRVVVQNVQGRHSQGYTGNAGRGRGTTTTRVVRIIWDLNANMPKKVEAYDLDCDDTPTTSAIFMAKLSPAGSINGDKSGPSYDSDILSEKLEGGGGC
ncbi:hypothetical protein Tco_1449067 [Tanacetum coccineum]